jgi:hypothetical protein
MGKKKNTGDRRQKTEDRIKADTGYSVLDSGC